MTKYLVTGATGNLGSASVENLLKTVPASDISVLARDAEKAKRFSDRGIKVFKGDYFELQSMIDAFTGIDELLLIGALSRSNRAPQHANMVKAIGAAKPGHVVYISLQRREHPKLKLFEVTDVENDTERHQGVGHRLHDRPEHAVLRGLHRLLRQRRPDDRRRACVRPRRQDNLRRHG